MPFAKRLKVEKLDLESLPNELFLEIFSYLSHVDTVYSFGILNRRLRSLVLNYCHSFDFRSVTKRKFDFVIKNCDASRWLSICLCDDHQTPGQLAYFLTLFSWSNHFSQLKFLSIHHPKLDQFIVNLSSLNQLTNLVSLSLTSWICAKAVSFTKLSSLKYLKLHSCLCSKWIENLNQLVELDHKLEHRCHHVRCLGWPKALKKLHVSYAERESEPCICEALRNSRELIHLSIYSNVLEGLAPSGYFWEELIKRSMPKLKTFQFSFQFWRDITIHSNIQRIIESFSSPFYIEEKKWFVRCDVYQQSFSTAVVYSLPYAFEQFHILTDSYEHSLTTLPPSMKKKALYRHVQHLVVEMPCKIIDRNILLSRIPQLTIKFFQDSLNWIFSMRFLREITLTSYHDMSSADFILLLNNSIYLDSLITPYSTLRFLTNKWTHESLCNLLSLRIVSLVIVPENRTINASNHYVKIDELIPIIRVFHHRCEHLTIAVYSRNIVSGFLLSKMVHLKSLKVTVIEHGNMKITKRWLFEQNCLATMRDYSISVNDDEYSFWFANR